MLTPDKTGNHAYTITAYSCVFTKEHEKILFKANKIYENKTYTKALSLGALAQRIFI